MTDPLNNSVRVEQNGAVVTVILHRPHARNAVDRPTAEALVKAFLAFEKNDDAKVAVFWGEGGTFCAGADLKAVAAGPTGARGNRMTEPQVGAKFDRLSGDGPMGPSRMVLSKPVIAAVAGHAVAGGLELALWCDMRVAEESAVFGVFCRRWGVPLIDGGTVRLPRLIGLSRALDLIMTGRPVDAREAFAMGLANRVVPNGQSRPEAERLANEIAKFPQLCMRNDRLSAYAQAGVPYDEAMAEEYRLGIEVLRSGESSAGAARFASGRGRGGKFDDI
jgi:enoyl-CoA hydratase